MFVSLCYNVESVEGWLVSAQIIVEEHIKVMIWEINRLTNMDRVYWQTKQYGGRCVAPVWPLYSPIELIVVIMCLPPEVEQDQQQTEGKKEDEGPQQLPLHTQKHCFIYVGPLYLIRSDKETHVTGVYLMTLKHV